MANEKFSISEAQEIINQFTNGKSTKQLSNEFNCCIQTVRDIVKGLKYKKCYRPSNIKEILKRHIDIDIDFKEPTDRQKEIINGSLLGDGTIANGGRIVKPQRKICKEYIDWHFDELKPFSSKVTELYKKEKLIHLPNLELTQKSVPKFLWGYAISTYTHSYFKNLQKIWYPKGIKVIPEGLDLTPLTLAIWFCDDGSNSYDKRTITLYTNGFTFKDVEMLKYKLYEKFSLNAKIYKQYGQPVLYLRSNDYINFLDIINPHMVWDCFAYKRNKNEIKNPQAVDLVDDQVKIILNAWNNKSSIDELLSIYNSNKSIIFNIISGRTYKHLQFLNKNPYKRFQKNRKRLFLYQCVETQETYSSMSQITKKYGVSQYYITKSIETGELLCGYHWTKIPKG